MKQLATSSALTTALAATLALPLALAAAACGGKAAPTVGNPAGGGTTTTPASPIAGGIHGCRFVIGGDVFAEHRCDVDGDTLDKVSGMETFKATLSPMGDGVHVIGELDCGPMVDRCGQQFQAHLTNQDGTWKGRVEPRGGEGGWWLDGAELQIDDSTAYGGTHYGKATE